MGELVISHNAGIYISKEDYGTGTNVIGVGNIYDNDIFDGEIYRLGPVNDEKFLLEENDLIYGESSLVPEGIARTVCVGKNGVGSAFAWHTRRVKLDQSVINSHFATLELNYNIEVRKYLISVSTQTALTGMTTEGYFGVTLSLPTVEEQAHISSFFKQLVNLITLQQRKYDKLVNVKKSMLEKMFPREGARVPEIRFEGFTDDWEQRKLGEMGTTFTGLSGKTKEDFGHGDAKFITYMNVFSNPVADLNMTEAVEIDTKQNDVKAGDVFFTTSSETPEEVGMSCVMPENADNIYLNSFCFGYRPTEKFDLNYLAYVLRADAFRKDMTFLAQGISRYNISKNKVMEVSIPVPSLEEQSMVGKYFSNLDNLITLQQRKLEKLKNIKKSMLEKMFV